MTSPACTSSAAMAWTPPSWEQLVRGHFQSVFHIAYRLTGDNYEAEDLAQEVFLRVWRSLGKLRPGSLEGWLYRVTRNLFIDRVRHRDRTLVVGLGERANSISGARPTPDESYELTHLDPELLGALRDLPRQYREAIVLYDLEGYSYEDIAGLMQVPLGTVRSRIARARQRLRQRLHHLRPERHSTRASSPQLAQ